MADISKITLPSGNTYNIKDATAREAIASLEGGSHFLGLTTTPITDQATTSPIVVDGNSIVPVNGNIVVYDRAEFIWNGTKWIEFGDLSNLGQLAYRNNVTISKGAGDNVLGVDTTFTSSTPTITVTPTTTNIKATASGAAVGADGTANAITGFGAHTTDTFVKSVSAETGNKLVTTTVPNVTNAGSASTWTFTMGTGANAETLIIDGANGSAPTLGTAKTVATGSVASDGTGSPVVTGVSIGTSASAITALGTPTTSACLTGVKVTSQPTIALATGATAGTGVISVATGITSATSTTPSITVGTNDQVKVAKYDDIAGGDGVSIITGSITTRTITVNHALHSTVNGHNSNYTLNVIDGSSATFEIQCDNGYALGTCTVKNPDTNNNILYNYSYTEKPYTSSTKWYVTINNITTNVSFTPNIIPCYMVTIPTTSSVQHLAYISENIGGYYIPGESIWVTLKSETDYKLNGVSCIKTGDSNTTITLSVDSGSITGTEATIVYTCPAYDNTLIVNDCIAV